ncbi:MAG: polyprenyl synthetase family protein [Kiritimatiellae bacterium]|nr:polyprenyl synthetase family protein [Kiritimatiellia bacterium]
MGVKEIAESFFGRGGKKLRPRLCRAVCEKALGGAAPANLAFLTDAVECFHKASLIHDDIQDGDETRYGAPAVWKEHGVGVAIAVGDWLVAHGYELVLSSGFPNAAEMLRATVKSHVALCEGQGDELTGAGDYLSVAARKTGEAFALAAELGALAAGADPAKYRAYGLAYGILFQIRDDLRDADGVGAPGREELERLEKKYADETAVHGDECALGVW